MNLEKVKLKNGDKMKINNLTYEVLYVQSEADPAPHQDPPFRKFLGIYLHDHKTKSLHPTHFIKYCYDDSQEIFLRELRGKQIRQEDISLESSTH